MQVPQLQLGVLDSPLLLREEVSSQQHWLWGTDSSWIRSGNQGWFCQHGATKRIEHFSSQTRLMSCGSTATRVNDAISRPA